MMHVISVIVFLILPIVVFAIGVYGVTNHTIWLRKHTNKWIKDGCPGGTDSTGPK